MALIQCPECGKEISDTKDTCIHCGYDIKKNNNVIKNASKKTRIMIYGLILGCIVLFILIGGILSTRLGNTDNDRSMTKDEIVEEELISTLKMHGNIYNDHLYYSSHYISYFDYVTDDTYEARGYILMNRRGSDKKWEADFECTCSYEQDTKEADCNCDLEDSATVIP